MKTTDNEFKMMTQQLRLTNSDEDVAAYLRWIIQSDTARDYWIPPKNTEVKLAQESPEFNICKVCGSKVVSTSGFPLDSSYCNDCYWGEK